MRRETLQALPATSSLQGPIRKEGSPEKQAIKYIVEKGKAPKVDMAEVEKLKERILTPLDLWEKHKNETTDPEVNTNYVIPRQYLHRLQKTHGRVCRRRGVRFQDQQGPLRKRYGVDGLLKEDSEKLAARNLHELMRVWENIQRTWQAEAHIRTILFREETRWPGYYFRADKPKMDDKNWLCFCNCQWDPQNR